MDAFQQFFLNLISSFTAEDIKDCIVYDKNLAVIINEEHPDMVDGFREWTRAYLTQHPEYKDRLADDKIPESARQVVAFLKSYRPDIGYEIEAMENYPTPIRAGIQLLKPGQVQGQAQELEHVHVGYRWVELNLMALRDLLLA